MNILYISQFYPESLLPIYMRRTISGLDYAAHNLNTAIIQGFKKNNKDIDIINVPHLGSFPPYYRYPYVEGLSTSEERLVSLSYINISYLKRYDINKRLNRYISDWCDKTNGEKLILFYNFTGLHLIPALKKRYKDLKVCLIVTDLPEYMAVDNSFLTRANKFISKYIIPSDKSYYNDIDGFILLAPGMAERLPIYNRPWIHIEGIYNSEADSVEDTKVSNKAILYTGNLGERYGIKELLQAFSGIADPNYRLWIRGNGECEKDVLEASMKDTRIEYFPPMSKNDLMALQKKATVLINPIYSTLEFTRYFFPSKTLEYLASGTPTIMSRLDCMPEDYSSHVYYFTDDSVEGMRNKIIEVCEKSETELADFGRSASNFILSKKTPGPQIKKMLEFLEQI